MVERVVGVAELTLKIIYRVSVRSTPKINQELRQKSLKLNEM